MTETTLKLKLAELLPEELENDGLGIAWKSRYSFANYRVEDTELLEICHRIEKKLTRTCYHDFEVNLMKVMQRKQRLLLADWQQRAQALIETLN